MDNDRCGRIGYAIIVISLMILTWFWVASYRAWIQVPVIIGQYTPKYVFVVEPASAVKPQGDQGWLPQ